MHMLLRQTDGTDYGRSGRRYLRSGCWRATVIRRQHSSAYRKRYHSLPTDTSISINSGDAYTNSTSATLTLAATGASEMMISEDSGFSGASYETYATSKSFTLSSGDGTENCITLNIRMTAGNESSATISDTIELDMTVPTVTVTTTETSPTNAVPIPVSITFSESVTGFDVTDLIVGNGSALATSAAVEHAYTADITPT